MEPHVVGIIGFGRFGRLWADVMALRHRVVVTDIVPQPDARFVSLPDLCATSQTIFLCVPINQFQTAVRELAGHLRPGTTVIDTCSVKVHPAQVLADELGERADLTLIATHPMFGPDSAARGVSGLPMVVWRVAGQEAVYREWVDFLSELGIHTVEMAPDDHDRLAAYSQGVTHYVGRVLSKLDLQATPIDTQGFKILRSLVAQTCNDSWELFHDLQTYNPYTSEMRVRLQHALNDVYRTLSPD
ncbi:MAG TPA: prephenate dehydrogenase/arogenate dehydrogenase family protein [Longimicrobiales bacterium]